MQLFKNTASQKLRVFAFADAGHASLDPGEPVTGDAANITARTALDNAALGASDDANPAEVDATNAPGYYEFDPTQAETNGDVIEWYGKSSTAGVQVVTVGGSVQVLLPPNFGNLGIESDGDLTKVNTLDGHTAQTGDSFARLGAPAGASFAADIAALPLQAEITGGAYALDTDANGRIRIVDGTGAGELNTASGSVDVVTIEGSDATNQINAACDAAIETYHLDHLFAVAYDATAKPGAADALLNEMVEDDSGVTRFTTNALENGPSGSGASAETIADAVWDEAQSGHTTAGTFGEIATEIASILDDVGTSGVVVNAAGLATDAVNEIRNAITGGAYALDTDANGRARIVDGTSAGELDTDSGTVLLRAATEAQIDAIEADTNELQGDWANGGRLDLILDARASQASVDALEDVSVSDILTTQMSESYAANGVVPTLAEALFAIHQHLMHFDISGTDYTVKKLDGSTAFVAELDDDTNPTSIAREAE